MSFDHVAVEVRNLGKSYNIYKRPQDRLKQSVIPRLQRLLGRPVNNFFREFWALRNVSFDVKRGETVGIVGRNGSGKSTLLQIISGTLNPTGGIVKTQGRIAALLELGSGFNPEFSGRENVYLNGAILGFSKEEIDVLFDDIAGFADIGEFIEQPVKMYSSGMVMRLAFAVQAMVNPDILIVDEALAVGDEKFQRKCFARIEELKSKGASILFVSHSGPHIIELCDRALLLEQGERLLFNEPLQVVRAYQKLIYAPAAQQTALVQEYKTVDHAGFDKTIIESTSDQNHNTPDKNKSGSRKPPDRSLGSKENKDDYLDAGLVPETTVNYPSQGARINSFRILSPDGRAVNVLLHGQNYTFEMTGEFLLDRSNIYFGVHIRSISGTIITGQRYPEGGNFIEKVQAGDKFKLTFEFKMILLPGVYFVGGGVWSSHQPSCLHRMLDAMMFRVDVSQKATSFGYVNASSASACLEIT